MCSMRLSTGKSSTPMRSLAPRNAVLPEGTVSRSNRFDAEGSDLLVPVALIAMSSAFGSEVNNAYADGQNQGLESYNGLEYNGRQI